VIDAVCADGVREAIECGNRNRLEQLVCRSVLAYFSGGGTAVSDRCLYYDRGDFWRRLHGIAFECFKESSLIESQLSLSILGEDGFRLAVGLICILLVYISSACAAMISNGAYRRSW